MTDLKFYLQQHFGISSDKMDAIIELFEEEIYLKDDFFAKSTQPCRKLSFVKEGYFRIYAYTDKKEVTQWVSGKGYFVTDLASFSLGGNSRWEIQALTGGTTYTINRTNYEKIGTLVPEWNTLEKLFLTKCFVTLENRVFSFLSKSALERYEELFQLDSGLFNQIPLQYLASMLGMTPETLSRIRKSNTS